MQQLKPVSIEHLTDYCPLIGYVTEMTYDRVSIYGNDYNSKRAGYIPKNSFLIVKTKLTSTPSNHVFFLLRVESISYTDGEDKKIKESIIRTLNTSAIDEEELSKPINSFNDKLTNHKLTFYQINTKLLGVFYIKESNGKKEVYFGKEGFHFNVSTTYLAYKPTNHFINLIVNYSHYNNDLSLYNSSRLGEKFFKIGKLKYTQTPSDIFEPNKIKNSTEDMPFYVYRNDFIAQKTAIFGQTRTGKSNTVKQIIKGINNTNPKKNNPLHSKNIRVGQLIYDINSEYSTNNKQNNQITDNLYTTNNSNPDIPPALNNFYLQPNYGLKTIQTGILMKDKDSNYLNVFLSIRDITDNPMLLLLWYLLLFKTGFEFPEDSDKLNQQLTDEQLIIKDNSLNFKVLYDRKERFIIMHFSHELCSEMNLLNGFKYLLGVFTTTQNNNNNSFLYSEKRGFYSVKINKEIIARIIKTKIEIIPPQQQNNSSPYSNNNKKPIHPLYSMLDNQESKTLLGLILKENRDNLSSRSTSGWEMLVEFKAYHSKYAIEDYREKIYQQLKNGDIVAINFGLKDSLSIYNDKGMTYIADEIMGYIFDEQIKRFGKINPNEPPYSILVIVEEAHKVIGKKAEVNSLWPVIAKEGAKYDIGLLYLTQEPSIIHESILANTSNFFIAHLNNDDEIKIISKYNDLSDFSQSIKEVHEGGFVRVKMLSKPYTVPIGIDKFEN